MGDLDDEDDDYQGLYENGHWEWCDINEGLVFISHNMNEESYTQQPNIAVIGSMDFRDDMDVIEQQKFRKRFQRKTNDGDVVLLQDVKDLVLFTAPKYLMTTTIIRIMHYPSTERFLRALIAYCQYYLQLTVTMSDRQAELQYKVKTPRTDEIEREFRENLEDLRLLLAKEYCSIILGSEEFSKFHHMGVSRKMRSLSKREAFQFESIVRLSTQIVWLALGRRSYNQIELEINRVFKSDIYNIVEHRLKLNYQGTLSATERLILFGSCVKRGTMITVNSPLINEINCNKTFPYQLLALGQVKYERLQPRLRYLEYLLVLPEKQFSDAGISIGILGLLRNRFDTMLKPINIVAPGKSSTSVSVKSVQSRLGSAASSKGISKKGLGDATKKLYDDIYLPEYEENNELPDSFPTENHRQNPCNMEQRKKWMMYIRKIRSSSPTR